MANAEYVALSRQTGLFRQMSVLAQNVANANTSAYKREDSLFQTFLTNAGSNQKVAYTNDVATYRDTSEGVFKTTGRQLDVAIHGRGYFVVDTPLGKRYTRAGNFSIDDRGILVNANGYEVLGPSGAPIAFDPEDREFIISEYGVIETIREGNEEERGQIGIVQFDNEQELERTGSNLYRSEIEPEITLDIRVVQGAVEESNVSGITEITNIIHVSRAVGSTSKFIVSIDELMRNAARKISERA